MVHITDKRDCCGCAACVQRCPRQCITLKEDHEGFFYPSVNPEECVGCGLCEEVCPLIGEVEKRKSEEVLAVKNLDEDEREASSSGGVFMALARKILDRGGVVFGAVFDEKWEVRHTYAETLEGVRPMMGSKYVQSRMENSYCEAERFLKDGREVLFSGCPCQIAGLHKFLRQDYPNLISVDVLCHGVPSPKVWREYLDESFNLSRPVITGIDFRDKRMSGWKDYCLVIRGTFGTEMNKDRILLSDRYYENTFLRGFLSDICIRPSCYTCRCKNGVSHSDLTLGDYWGIDILMPDFDDDKGVGLVLINTDKGKMVFDGLDMEVRPTVLEDAVHFNGGFKEEVRPHPERSRFFRMVGSGSGVELAVNKCLYVSLYRRFVWKVKSIATHIIGQSRIDKHLWRMNHDI